MGPLDRTGAHRGRQRRTVVLHQRCESEVAGFPAVRWASTFIIAGTNEVILAMEDHDLVITEKRTDTPTARPAPGLPLRCRPSWFSNRACRLYQGSGSSHPVGPNQSNGIQGLAEHASLSQSLEYVLSRIRLDTLKSCPIVCSLLACVADLNAEIFAQVWADHETRPYVDMNLTTREDRCRGGWSGDVSSGRSHIERYRSPGQALSSRLA